jgi:hypothetical protein
MQIAKINEIIENGQIIVNYDTETGLIISATIENYFTYFVISDTAECEHASTFPVEPYIKKVGIDSNDTIVDVLINGAKKLAEEIHKNKVNL